MKAAWLLVPLGLLALFAPTATSLTMAPGSLARYPWAASTNDTVPFFLSWRDGTGALAPAMDPNSADPGGQGAAGTIDPSLAEATLGRRLGTDLGRVVDRFESLPVPSNLYINNSRPIQLLLYRQWPNSDCASGPRIDVRLYLIQGNEETLVGGALDGTFGITFIKDWDVRGLANRPANPLGYCGVYLPFFSEVSLIPAGGRLRLEVEQRHEYPTVRPAAFGMGERHASLMRLPVFPRAEYLFRRAEFHELVGAPTEASVSAAAFLAPLALVAAGDRRRLGILAVAALILSGCLGADRPGSVKSLSPEGPPRATGAADVSIVDDPTAHGDQGTGSIAGRVRDELGTPLAGAYVSLVGRSNYTVTNRYGFYEISPVDPGNYELRADQNGHASLQVVLEVRAGQLTRVDVTLPLLGDRPPNARPHHHADEWRAPVETLWRDLPVAFQAQVLSGYAGPAKVPTVCSALIAFSSLPLVSACKQDVPTPNSQPGTVLVRPGTDELVVWLNFTTDASLTARELGLTFVSNQQLPDSYSTWQATIALLPRPSGVPFRIPTTWEMTDVGHQKFTTWRFSVYALLAPAAAEVLEGPVKMDAVIRRGVVPYEPPHPDPWDKNLTYPLVTDNKFCSAGIGSYGSRYQCSPSDPFGRPVADGTRWIEVWANQSVTARPYDRLGLEVKTAQTAQWPSTPLTGKTYRSPETAEGQYRTWFAVCVAPADADAAYQRVSLWQLRFIDSTGQTYITEQTTSVRPAPPYNIYMGAIAHRDPPPIPCP